MFENILKFFKKAKKEEKNNTDSKSAAKERLHLVLMQDRANVSADFLDLMRQEIIDVIKKYIEIDESAIDVRLTNKENEDGTNGAPALYANIPILNIKNEARKIEGTNNKENKEETKKEDIKQEEKFEQSKVEEKNQKEDVQEVKEEIEENNTGSNEEKEQEDDEITTEN